MTQLWPIKYKLWACYESWSLHISSCSSLLCVVTDGPETVTLCTLQERADCIFTRAQECTFLPFPPLGQTGLAKLPRKKLLFQMVLSCTTGRDKPFPKTPVQQGESPSFPSALLLLACKARKWWHSSGGTYLSTSGHKIHIYWGDWLHLQDGLLLKTEEIRFQAALGNRNGQISFLNMLSDLEYSSQAGKKKYSFCNLPLL